MSDDERCEKCGKLKAMHEALYAPTMKGQVLNIPANACGNTPIIVPPTAGPTVRNAN